MAKFTFSSTLSTGTLRDTPIGCIGLAASDHGLVSVEITDDLDSYHRQIDGYSNQGEPGNPAHRNSLMALAMQQLLEYLGGKRHDFDLPLDWSIFEPFQEKVMRALVAIPFGQIKTYGQVAREIGHPGAARAVGAANAANPMAIVVPCHRLVGGDGSLHGYGAPGGIATKAWLLTLEGHAMRGLRLAERP